MANTPNYNLKVYYSDIPTDVLDDFSEYIDNNSDNFATIDTELNRVEEQTDSKRTGWDPNQTFPDITFDDGTLTLTIEGNGATYWVNNIQYVLDIDAEVVASADEGSHWFYFTSAGLQTSTSIWPFDETTCPAAITYWDATNAKHIGIGFEMHKWTMTRDEHKYLHQTRGTAYSHGLAVVEASPTTLNTYTGSIFDEDIDLAIGSLIGTSQQLAPLSAPIYYRDGSQTNIRRIDASTIFVYLNPEPQINIFSGGAWIWEPVANAKYFAYWVLATHKFTNSVIIIPGQFEGGTLNEAKEQNTLESLDLGGLDFAEYVVLARVISQATPTSYTIAEITDYRVGRNSGSQVTSVPSSVMDVVPDIATRDAIDNPPTGKQVHVTDASGDSDVYTGWAQYIYNGASWTKTLEDPANTSFGVYYQADEDTYQMNTTGTDTYVGNKMEIPLTECGVQGGSSLNLVDGRIKHVGRDTKYLFNATATVHDCSTPNMTIHFILVKNGTEFLDVSQSYGRLESVAGAMSLDAASCVDMEDGDFLEIFCKTDKLNGSFWVDSMQLQLNQVPQ